MKHRRLCILIFLFAGISTVHAAGEGVAIQRVITNTRAELGQLATSSKAIEVSKLMEKFDTQYTTWDKSCGEQFDPGQMNEVNDACKMEAEQMRETGIKLYSKLSKYLPDVAARYKQGALSAQQIVQEKVRGYTPAELYERTRKGVQSTKPHVAGMGEGGQGGPYPVMRDDFPDQTQELFTALEKLVPDFGHQAPEGVRAGNTQINMSRKAEKARYLAAQFEKAKFALESQRDYGQIIFSTTEAVKAMPKVLGIQYTGTHLSATPNRKVLDYYRNNGKGPAKNQKKKKKKGGGGFSPRS